MHWYHEECMKIKDEERGIWYCPNCRLMPSNISKLLGEIQRLHDDMRRIKETEHKTHEILSLIKCECEHLREENASLKTQITSLSQQSFTNGNRKSLLIGDSIVRDIDENKLVKTQVTSLPGAKVTDVLKYLEDNDDSYKSVICCVGTNNCNEDDFKGNDVSSVYRDIITAAKLKVRDPEDVLIVSIPPRTDSTTKQENVDIMNDCLSTITRDNGVTFINNDLTFKLTDGTPNDGYLQQDGLHLTNKGTNRLAKNMQLKVSPDATNGNVVKTKKHQKQNLRNRQPAAATADCDWQDANGANGLGKNNGDWQEVNYKSGSQRYSKQRDTEGNHRGTNSGYRQTSHKCWFCGEANHVSHNCRHGHKLTCHNCQALGHKAKNCPQ